MLLFAPVGVCKHGHDQRSVTYIFLADYSLLCRHVSLCIALYIDEGGGNNGNIYCEYVMPVGQK